MLVGAAIIRLNDISDASFNGSIRFVHIQVETNSRRSSFEIGFLCEQYSDWSMWNLLWTFISDEHAQWSLSSRIDTRIEILFEVKFLSPSTADHVADLCSHCQMSVEPRDGTWLLWPRLSPSSSWHRFRILIEDIDDESIQWQRWTLLSLARSNNPPMTRVTDRQRKWAFVRCDQETILDR